MSGDFPEAPGGRTAPVITQIARGASSSSCNQQTVADPLRGAVAPPSDLRRTTRWTPSCMQHEAADSAEQPSAHPAVAAVGVFEEATRTYPNNEGSASCACKSTSSKTALGVAGWARGNSEDQSDTSFVVTQCPNLEVTNCKCQRGFAERLLGCPRRACERLSEPTDRILVLLWRAFIFKARYPMSTLIGILVPVALVLSACVILARHQDAEVTYVPSNTSSGNFLKCEFGAYGNLNSLLASTYDPCFAPYSLMAPFGRRYDGLHLMYLPALLHYGGYLAFVDKSGSDCHEFRKFMGAFARTVSPYLMDRIKESDLFISFPSEKALDKYRRSAAGFKRRPIYSAFICRAAAPGQLDITIRTHVRRGTPRSFANDTIKPLRRVHSGYDSMTYFGGSNFLLMADVIGTSAEGNAYGHLSGGFLDLLTLAHVFNLDRNGIRRLPAGSPVSKELQPQWYLTSEVFFKMFDYFGRVPVLNSVAFSRNIKGILETLVGEAERNLAEVLALVSCLSASYGQGSTESRKKMYHRLIASWPFVPSFDTVRLYAESATKQGCNLQTSAMQILKQMFYSHTKDIGPALVIVAVGPLHSLLREYSAPFRQAYSPLNFMESGMPHQPATVVSRSGKPPSCAAPFVIFLICILWQVVKAIMVDKETGFKNMLKILGLSDKVLWLSWYLFFIFYNLPVLLIIAAISNYFVFTFSNFWLIFLLFFLATTASISFALFITALFTDGNFAAMAACGWYILVWVPVVCQRFGSAAWNPHMQRAFMVSCPAAALGVGLDIAWLFNEPYIGGIRGSVANLPALGITVVDTFVALGTSTILFLLLGCYLHKVLPTSNGNPEHPVFFLASFLSFARSCFSLCNSRLGCLQRLGLWDPRRFQSLRVTSEGPYCLNRDGAVNGEGMPILDVRGVCKTFHTWQPKKCSRTQVCAVKGVSFSVFRDEIFGLLGQNGAGKTTLISVITGLLTATAGEVLLGGVSIRQHPHHARRNIGYCPQFDVLLPYLTVEETLWVYASLRGVPRGRRRDAVTQLMTMMKLSEMATVLVHALSGGWRRRVSSSIAFLGDPTVVFLDEPTAGMDIMYRRTFWDSVRCLSKGRSVVLITHMMEEADYLCDRLAIMGEGTIICSGTALSLKSRFGSGYIVSLISKKQGEREEQQAKQKLRLLLQTFEQPPLIEEVSRHELRIICPLSRSSQLPLLFSELESKGPSYGVESAVLGFAPLEEVFINVVRLPAQTKTLDILKTKGAAGTDGSLLENANGSAGSLCSSQGCAKPGCSSIPETLISRERDQPCNSAPSASHGTSGPTEAAYSGIKCTEDKRYMCTKGRSNSGWSPVAYDKSGNVRSNPNLSHGGSALFSLYQSSIHSRTGLRRQVLIMHALLVKRIRLLYRDWALVTVSFLIPLLLIGLTIYLRSAKAEPRVPLTGLQLFEYRLPKGFDAQLPYGGTGWIINSLDRCNSPFITHDNASKEVRSNDDMYNFLLKGYVGPHPPRFGAYVVPNDQPDLSDVASQIDVTIWHNSTLRDSLPLYYNHFLNCLAENRTGVTDAVFSSNEPFEDADDQSMDGIVVAFFTIIAYSFVGAGVGKICIVERVRKVRHQQVLAGVTPFQYWLSCYIVDVVLLIVPCLLIFAMLLWANISPLVGPDQRVAFLLGTLLFCLSVCPLGYTISMGLDSPMTFVIVMLLLGWSLPSIQALFTKVDGLDGVYKEYLRYVFMLIPHAALAELLTNTAMLNQLTSGPVKADELVNWMDFQNIACPLLYLGVTVLLNWTLCFFLDRNTNFPRSKARVKALAQKMVTLFAACLRLRVCCWCYRRPRQLTGNTIGDNNEEASTTRGPQNHATSKPLRSCGSGELVVNSRYIDCQGLHVKDEEARAEEAVRRLRRRCHGDTFVPALSPQFQRPSGRRDILEDFSATVSPSISDFGLPNKDESSLILVVDKLQKTYSAPMLQRCLCCFSPKSGCSNSQLCPCCKRALSTRALKGVSFCVPKGSCMAYIGVNGSGKSTTFNIICNLMRHSAGTVYIDGWDVLSHPQKARAKLRYCPQTDALLPTLTGAEHVCLYGYLLGLSGFQLRRLCDEFFDSIGCTKYMNRLVKSYSGGTKRKLSLGLAMLGNVDLLLLDEPTSGVDPESRQTLWRMIEDSKNCKIAGKAILLTSHSMEECEVLGDRVGIIHNGKMLCLGTPTELRAKYGHGYQIECVFAASTVALHPSLPRLFISALLRKLPTMRIVHQMAYKVTTSVAKGDASLATIFCEIEAIKGSFALEAYAVSETTLEEVFVTVNQVAEQEEKE